MTNVPLGCVEWVSLGSAQAGIRRTRIQRGTAERQRRGLDSWNEPRVSPQQPDHHGYPAAI